MEHQYYTFTIGTYSSSINILDITKSICYENYKKNCMLLIKEVSPNSYSHVHIIYFYTSDEIVDFSKRKILGVKITKPQLVTTPKNLLTYMLKTNPKPEDTFFYEPYREYALFNKAQDTYKFIPRYQPFILQIILKLEISHPTIEHILNLHLHKILYLTFQIHKTVIPTLKKYYLPVYQQLEYLINILDTSSYKASSVTSFDETYKYLYRTSDDPLWKDITHNDNYLFDEPAVF